MERFSVIMPAYNQGNIDPQFIRSKSPDVFPDLSQLTCER